jgi:hypothetical protein
MDQNQWNQQYQAMDHLDLLPEWKRSDWFLNSQLKSKVVEDFYILGSITQVKSYC